MIENFKPNLFDNKATKLEDMPDKVYLVSVKLDGIRCIFKDGRMLSRSLKEIPNKQLHHEFDHLKKYSEKTGTILDGEIYAHGMSFQEITSVVMTHDKLVPPEIRFWCFDALNEDARDQPFEMRLTKIPQRYRLNTVAQNFIDDKEIIKENMSDAIQDGYEGLMLRCPNSKYKFGRVTAKSGDGYKLKSYETFDAQITGFVEATVVNPNAEKKTNELGASVTSKKKGDRIPIEAISCFTCQYNGMEQKVVYAATDAEREHMWHHQDEYLGKWMEFKGMLVGSKDLIRHPVFVRFRDDK